MPNPYSRELRERVIARVESGASRREAAEQFEVSASASVKWLQRWHDTGSSKDIVIMDNLGAHKVAEIRQAIEAAGATLCYLPHYSPDLNPIEMPFSKFKAFLRKVAEPTISGLYRRIRFFYRGLSTREAFNYFRHAGYAYK
jgi:hypothetical protein